MSHVAMESAAMTCASEAELSTFSVAVGSFGFVDEVLQMQAEASFDELGDSFVEGKGAVQEALRRAGVELSDAMATQLFRSTITCLQQRYLGNCAVAKNCTGRTFMDSRLTALGIGKYKTELEAQI